MFDVGRVFISDLFMWPEDGTFCLVTFKSGTNPWVTVGSTQNTKAQMGEVRKSSEEKEIFPRRKRNGDWKSFFFSYLLDGDDCVSSSLSSFLQLIIHHR